MTKALIIGCGNIGALYDFESDAVGTYAKAFHRAGVDFSVYDPDALVAQKVADRYRVAALKQWDECALDSYDIAVISSPTPTHYRYLTELLDCPPRLIICEKPVDTDPARLEEIVQHYAQAGARVMVNFHRRYLPRMAELGARLRNWQLEESCRTAVVTYQRGFHNNASHAMDLLGFLFARPFSPTHVQIARSVADEFADDPTITLSCRWNGIHVQFVGLAESRFSHFELSLHFPTRQVTLRRGGDEIDFLVAPAKRGTFYPALESEEKWNGVLRDHMSEVVAHAGRMLKDPDLPDNFLESAGISRAIIEITKQAQS